MPTHILHTEDEDMYSGYRIPKRLSYPALLTFLEALKLSGVRKIMLTEKLRYQNPKLETILRNQFEVQYERDMTDPYHPRTIKIPVDKLMYQEIFFPHRYEKPTAYVPKLSAAEFEDFKVIRDVYLKKNVARGIIPAISVVIPFYKKREFLEQTLVQLFSQECNFNVEIILVDDGSNFGFDLVEFYKTEIIPHNFNLRMVQISRRKNNRKVFRAGFARNAGAISAKGKRLLFLDSDIWVPEKFLQNIHDYALSHPASDKLVLQSPRLAWNLSSEDQYWEDFYKSEVQWKDIPDGWKYVCSHSLFINREVFVNSCRFPLYYLSYGYEDVHLGYWLWKKDFVFELFSENVVHIDPDDNQELTFERWRSLRVTGELFLRNFMSPEIREHCSYLFGWKRHFMHLLKLKSFWNLRLFFRV